MPYNPHIHHRRSIRLKGYDYSQAGIYYITICVKDRDCLFGEIKDGKMILNDAGIMVEKWYYELQNKYADIKCHEMVVMPNHFHCIIENVGPVVDNIGADLRVCPNMDEQTSMDEMGIFGEHIGSPLHRVVQWFKTMSTNEYIRGVKSLDWKPFNGKLWQRNYWEHIIRNEPSYHRITEYIIKNPVNWDNDKLNKK